MENWRTLIPESIAGKYEFFNFSGALEILTQSYPMAFAEIVGTLEQFDVVTADILEKGGNESPIPTACLKIVNTPKRRFFFRHASPIFLAIHQVFLRQIDFA